jgi:hypothetical protein
MKPWSQLLGRKYESITDQYGPHSQQVASAFEILAETDWFSTVDEPLEPTASIVKVASWSEALAFYQGEMAYGGHPVGPASRCRAVAKAARYERWWRAAVDEADDYMNPLPYIPRSLPDDDRTIVNEYVVAFMWWLMGEVIAPDETGTTYFREMLAWFHAGRFPCGWEGDWPVGKLRVF